MATTYTLIAGETLASSAASYTFSAIPNTYTDLVLKLSTRGSDAATTQHWLYFNGDTSTSYSNTFLSANGASAYSSSVVDNIRFRAAYRNASDSTASSFASTELYFPSYTVSQNKPVSVTGVTENNADYDKIATSVWAGLWRNNAAITSIQVLAPTGTYEPGSSFYLYGIKNS